MSGQTQTILDQIEAGIKRNKGKVESVHVSRALWSDLVLMQDDTRLEVISASPMSKGWPTEKNVLRLNGIPIVVDETLKGCNIELWDFDSTAERAVDTADGADAYYDADDAPNECCVHSSNSAFNRKLAAGLEHLKQRIVDIEAKQEVNKGLADLLDVRWKQIQELQAENRELRAENQELSELKTTNRVLQKAVERLQLQKFGAEELGYNSREPELFAQPDDPGQQSQQSNLNKVRAYQQRHDGQIAGVPE